MGFAQRIEAVPDASAGTRVDPGGSQYRCMPASGRRLLRAAEGPYTQPRCGRRTAPIIGYLNTVDLKNKDPSSAR
jgi:hypothetical protein